MVFVLSYKQIVNPPFRQKKVGVSEACYMNLVHEKDLDADFLSVCHVTGIKSVQWASVSQKYALMSNQLKHEQMYL
jgi:hypothetical protein